MGGYRQLHGKSKLLVFERMLDGKFVVVAINIDGKESAPGSIRHSLLASL